MPAAGNRVHRAARPGGDAAVVRKRRGTGVPGVQPEQAGDGHRELLSGQVAVRVEAGPAAAVQLALHHAAGVQLARIAAGPVVCRVRERAFCAAGGHRSADARAVARVVRYVDGDRVRAGCQCAGGDGQVLAAHAGRAGYRLAVHLDRDIRGARRVFAALHGGGAGDRGGSAGGDRQRRAVQRTAGASVLVTAWSAETTI